MEDGGDKQMVNVCGGGRSALKDPQFLIEHDGKLYLTLAVLEFDPKHPSMTAEQKRDISDLRSILADNALPGLVTPYETRARIFAATNPPQPVDG